jgi:hypothetical protein
LNLLSAVPFLSRYVSLISSMPVFACDNMSDQRN